MAIIRPLIIGFATTLDYELAVYRKDDFVWDKEDLLVPASTTAAPASRVGSVGSARCEG